MDLEFLMVLTYHLVDNMPVRNLNWKLLLNQIIDPTLNFYIKPYHNLIIFQQIQLITSLMKTLNLMNMITNITMRYQKEHLHLWTHTTELIKLNTCLLATLLVTWLVTGLQPRKQNPRGFNLKPWNLLPQKYSDNKLFHKHL